MAKAMTVVLLLAASAAFASAGLGHHGIAVTAGAAGNDTGAASAAGNGNGTTVAFAHPFKHGGETDLSNCQCKDDCDEQTRKVCTVKEVPKEVCKTVKGEEDIVECKNKCFKADKVINIDLSGAHGKGRRLLGADHIPHLVVKAAIAHAALKAAAAAVAAHSAGGNGTASYQGSGNGTATYFHKGVAVAAGGNDTAPTYYNHGAIFYHGNGSVAGRRLQGAVLPHLAAKAAIAHAALSAHAGGNDTESGGQQEICREICKPGKKPTSEKKCETVAEKKYNCKEEVVSRRCVKRCQCGHKTITVSQSPDYAAALAKHHPIAAVAHAVLG